MKIKIEKIHRLPEGSRLKAFFDVSFNDVLLVKGYRLVDGKTGLFVSAPQEQGRDCRWYDMVRIMSDELNAKIAELAISAYECEKDLREVQ